VGFSIFRWLLYGEFLAHDLSAAEAGSSAPCSHPFGPARFSIELQGRWRTSLLVRRTDEDRIMFPPCSARSLPGSVRASSPYAPVSTVSLEPKDTAEVIVAPVDFVRGKQPGQ